MRFLKIFIFLLFTPVLFSTTIVYVPVDESISLSNFILKGEVLDTYAGYDLKGQVVTNVVLYVEETLKGDLKEGSTFVFQVWGGKIDGIEVETVGEAKYEKGEKILVQLEEIDGSYHTLGLSFGKWKVMEKDGREVLLRDLSDLCFVNEDEGLLTIIGIDEFKNVLKNLEVKK